MQENKKVEKIIKLRKEKKGNLLPILQDVQKQYGFISEDAIYTIAKNLKTSENEIYGVVTFYTQFRLTKPGDHVIKVCMGTACHAKGSALNLQQIQKSIGIKEGEVTADNRFGLETVFCVGSCALAPLVVIDDKYHGNMSPKKMEKILSQYPKKVFENIKKS